MNRKKKIIQTLKKKDKKQKAKLQKSNKPRYISKAEREKMAQDEALSGSENAEVVVEQSEATDTDEQ